MDFKVCPDGTAAPVPVGQCCPSLTACKTKLDVVTPVKPINCALAFCTMDLKICPDGTPAPVPAGACCPSLTACNFKPINCAAAFCTMDLKICPDGTAAPVPAGECCQSLKACATTGAISRRSSPLGSLGSLLSGNNLLQTLTGATHGTDIGTVLSILNLLNNIQQLSTDIHQIPLLINQTLAGILNGTGQAGQIIIDQLVGAVTAHQASASRNLLGALGQNANLLSSISHLLPAGTSISTVLAILKLLNNVNALNNDIHQIPVLLNQTLAGLVGGAGQASQIVVQQILGLVGVQSQADSRSLLGTLGQNANLLATVSHLLPAGTSISTVLAILKLLNNVNALTNDIHQIPVLLQETIQNILGGVQNLIPPTIQPL
jgi:riboflavin transporter FmnP